MSMEQVLRNNYFIFFPLLLLQMSFFPIQTIKLLRVSIILLCLLAIANAIWETMGIITYVAYNLHSPPECATTTEMLLFYILLFQLLLCIVYSVTYIFRQVLPFDRGNVLLCIILVYSLIVCIALIVWSILMYMAALPPVLNYKEFFTNSFGVVIINLIIIVLTFLAESYQSQLAYHNSIDFP